MNSNKPLSNTANYSTRLTVDKNEICGIWLTIRAEEEKTCWNGYSYTYQKNLTFGTISVVTLLHSYRIVAIILSQQLQIVNFFNFRTSLFNIFYVFFCFFNVETDNNFLVKLNFKAIFSFIYWNWLNISLQNAK